MFQSCLETYVSLILKYSEAYVSSFPVQTSTYFFPAANQNLANAKRWIEVLMQRTKLSELSSW